MASTTRVAQRGPVASMRCSSREMVTTSGASRASENAMTGCSVTSGNFAPRTRPSKAPGASASTTSLMASFAATIARSTGFDASRNHAPNVAGAGLDDEAVTDHVTVRAALARATAHARTARTARRAPARSDRARARRAASRRFGDATREVSPSSKSGLTCFVRETNPFQRSWFICFITPLAIDRLPRWSSRDAIALQRALCAAPVRSSAVARARRLPRADEAAGGERLWLEETPSPPDCPDRQEYLRPRLF